MIYEAKKTEKLAYLVVSVVFAVACLVGIVLGAISIFTAK